uniref:Uncharacterized protein n=1 Tax=Arundo donax TaxID=35708 RepID=A0A0A9ETY8_ARUDO
MNPVLQYEHIDVIRFKSCAAAALFLL